MYFESILGVRCVVAEPMCSFFRFFSVALNEKNVTNFEIGLNKPLDCSEDCGQGGICLALCEIQWVIKFQLTAKEVNHINEIVDIAIASGSPFSQLNLTINTFKNAVSNM